MKIVNKKKFLVRILEIAIFIGMTSERKKALISRLLAIICMRIVISLLLFR